MIPEPSSLDAVAPRRPLQRMVGFTLIEILVVLIIVGVLAAIAMPSYRQYVMRGNRSGAEQFMLSLSNAQEQYRLDNRGYAASLADLSASIPSEVAANYSIAISGGGATYQITATAINAQAADGNLTLDSTGAKTPVEKW